MIWCHSASSHQVVGTGRKEGPHLGALFLCYVSIASISIINGVRYIISIVIARISAIVIRNPFIRENIVLTTIARHFRFYSVRALVLFSRLPSFLRPPPLRRRRCVMQNEAAH